MPVVAVGAIAAVIAALMALLLLYGSAALTKMVANLIPNWHIPGLGNIRGFALGAANAALHTIAGWLDSAVGLAAHWILAPWHILNQLFAKVIAAEHALYHAILAVRHLAGVLYARATALAYRLARDAQGFARALFAAAELAARALFAQAMATITRLINDVIGLVHAVLATAQAYALGLFNSAAALVFRLVTDVERFASALFAQAIAHAEARFAQAIAHAEAVARSAAAAAIGILTTDIAHAVHIPWVQITDEVKALEGVIATDLPDLGALVRAIPRAVPLDIATTLAGVLAIDRVAIKYLEECGIPNCKNLGGLGKDLLKLLELVGGAGLLAYLAAMVHDPGGTADETDRVLSGLVQDTVTGFRDLIGV
jgi:hypothetical protein